MTQQLQRFGEGIDVQFPARRLFPPLLPEFMHAPRVVGTLPQTYRPDRDGLPREFANLLTLLRGNLREKQNIGFPCPLGARHDIAGMFFKKRRKWEQLVFRHVISAWKGSCHR